MDRGDQSARCGLRRPPIRATPWMPIDGTEQMILGNLSILTEGGPVKVAPATDETKVADRNAGG